MTFFERPAVRVARDLLGKKIVRCRGGARIASTIVETEAYEGVHDLASHSSKGSTSRTEVMFGPAGRFYVYRIYGLHWMFNVVTGAESEGAAVLIRGVEGLDGLGRVTAALGIDASFYGKEARPETGLWFEREERAADTGDPPHWGSLRRDRSGLPRSGALCWPDPLRSALQMNNLRFHSTRFDLEPRERHRAKGPTDLERAWSASARLV